MTKKISITVLKAIMFGVVTFVVCQYANLHINFARLLTEMSPKELGAAVVVSYLSSAAVSHQLEKWED